MEVRLLGPVRLVRDGGDVGVGNRKRRFVLALLALEPNHLVTVDRLIDLLWPDGPPATARGVIHGHVSGLRAVLSAAGPAADELSVQREGPGYLLSCDPMNVDAHRFSQLVALALAEPDAVRRLSTLERALELWRGPALADTATEPVRAGLTRHLDEARSVAEEHRLAALLELGRHYEAVPDLTLMAAEHPDRHRVIELQMIALHRTGRTTDALAVYRDAKRRLAEEQGLDPPAQLQQLELALLRDQPGPAAAAARPAPISAPAHLPADVYGFVGRSDAIARLDTLLSGADQPTAVVISALFGTAGVGKTALAVHWAHRVADRFPDGQLYINLRGFDRGGTAATPVEALRSFLDALEVPARRVPVGLETQTALYRTLMAERRMLVLLDNARDADQVRPLLPGAPGSLVLITSRRQLTGLIAGTGAVALPLDVLNRDEAGELLARRLGARRIAAEPAAVGDIIEHCARLPLALAIVAARAATEPERSLAMLATELSRPQGRLDTLATGDAGTDLRSVLSWSYQQLTRPAAAVFRLLGLHPSPELAASAAASLAAIPLERARLLLAELDRAHLVTERVPGRYTLHDLLRVYAAELAVSDESEADRKAAVHRLLDHYVRGAHRADAVLNPARDGIELTPALDGVTVDEIGSAAAAAHWFTVEHHALRAAVALAADAGLDRHAWQLVWSMAPFIDHRGYRDAITLHDVALRAAQRMGDLSAQAYSHRRLGPAHAMLGEDDEALAHYDHALEVYRQLGDDTNQAQVHLGLARMLDLQGRYQDALHQAAQALTRSQAGGHLVGQANALNNLGWIQIRLGDYDTALEYCQQAVSLHQELGDSLGEAASWDSLGLAHHHLGRHTDAVNAYQQALRLHRERGSRYYEAETLVHLGEAHRANGSTDAARECWQQALAIFTELNHQDAEQVRARLRNAP